jgi:outer membrane immunogenic protein
MRSSGLNQDSAGAMGASVTEASRYEVGGLMKRFAIAGFALGMMATAAAAADMPVPYAKAPPPPEFSWTGLYVGGNAGWLQLEDNGYPYCLDPTGAMQGPGCTIVQGGQMDGHGFFGGGQVGYNWQAGKLVLGIEADMQGTSLKASENISGPFAIVNAGGFPIPPVPGSFTATESVSWFGTLRGRFGVAFDRLLIYMTGGLAMGGVDVTQAYNFPAAAPSPVQYASNTSRVLNGWTFGGGVEWAFLDRWSVKAEGGYYDLGTISTVGAMVPNPTAAPTFLLGKTFETRGAFARAGVNFKLWEPAPPVNSATY